MKNSSIFTLILVATLFFSTSAMARDWPEVRGQWTLEKAAEEKAKYNAVNNGKCRGVYETSASTPESCREAIDSEKRKILDEESQIEAKLRAPSIVVRSSEDGSSQPDNSTDKDVSSGEANAVESGSETDE